MKSAWAPLNCCRVVESPIHEWVRCTWAQTSTTTIPLSQQDRKVTWRVYRMWVSRPSKARLPKSVSLQRFYWRRPRRWSVLLRQQHVRERKKEKKQKQQHVYSTLGPLHNHRAASYFQWLMIFFFFFGSLATSQDRARPSQAKPANGSASSIAPRVGIELHSTARGEEREREKKK